jgi:surface polysaccharide O-acyltransferase-like enzyme
VSDKKARLFFIDNLRIILIVGVVLVHLAVTYGAPGTWYYHEVAEPETISLIVYAPLGAVGQSLMGFFFLISAYFIPGSFDRKGPGRFLKDRLLSLGLPLFLFILILDPLVVFSIKVTLHGYSGSFWEYLSNQHFMNYTSLGVGPLWFVEALLIFTLFYVLGRVLSKPASSNPDSPMPGNLGIAAFAFALGVITFILRIWLPTGWIIKPFGLPISSFPQYICLFYLGTVGYYRNWFLRISDSMGKQWLWVSIILVVVVFPVMFVAGGVLDGDVEPFMGGVHWQSFVLAIWEQFVCLGLVITFLVWFRTRFNYQGRLAGLMSASAYTVYLIHAPVLVLVGLGLRNIALHPLLKFFLVSPLAISLCFMISHYLKKLPIARNIL